jgi:hypothetical protein
MPFEITREVRSTYTLYRVQGETTFEGMMALIDQLADDFDRPTNCVLLDCAGMTGGIPLAKLFKVSDHMGKRLPKVYVGAVNMPEHWHNNQFCEDAVYVRGGVLVHFATLAKAEAWFAQQQRRAGA